MPPKKRSAPTSRSKSKRPRASELTEETAESWSFTTTPLQNLMTGRASAVGNCISCCHPSCPAGIRAGQQNTNSDRYRERACRGVGTGWSFRAHRRYGHQFQVHGTTLSLPANREPFASIAVALGSRVSPKLKAKIWANEFIKFRSLLTSAPNQDRCSVCLTPSPNSSNQPRLTLEPCHPFKNNSHLYSMAVSL